MKGAAYSLLTLGILGAGASYKALPHESLTSVLTHATSPDCIMLWRSIGAGLLMLPTWTYNLKARKHCCHHAAHVYTAHMKPQCVETADSVQCFETRPRLCTAAMGRAVCQTLNKGHFVSGSPVHSGCIRIA